MPKQRDIRGFRAIYHRNGVCGQGFHACSFLYRQAPGDWVALKAIVFPESGYCAVTSEDPWQRWRGDHFADLLREAIKLQDEAQPELAYQ